MTRRANWTKGAAMFLAVATLPMAGCTTTSSVDVTRFHGEAVPRAGNVVVTPADPRDGASLEFRTTANAVAASLKRIGFVVLDEGAANAMYRAVVDVRRETIEPARERRSPVSVGVGGSTGSYGSGLGLGVGIDLSGKPKPIVTTQLRLQILPMGGGQAVWEGRAETAAKQGSPDAQPGAAAAKLADALFREYPGVSGKTVTVQ